MSTTATIERPTSKRVPLKLNRNTVRQADFGLHPEGIYKGDVYKANAVVSITDCRILRRSSVVRC